MADLGVRSKVTVVSGALTLVVAAGIAAPWTVRADTVAYLVNVTVRPGYNFINADHALSYGYGICDRVRIGEHYGHLVDRTTADFHSEDPYQGSYLIGQAVNELCPQHIWQLRNSAANYSPRVS